MFYTEKVSVAFIPVPSVISGTLGKAEKVGKGGKAVIGGIDDIGAIDGIGCIGGFGETGVTVGIKSVDAGARVEGTECTAGIGIGGIIVPITGRTGTAKKILKIKLYLTRMTVNVSSNALYTLALY